MIELIRASPAAVVAQRAKLRELEFDAEDYPLFKASLITVTFDKVEPIGIRLGLAAEDSTLLELLEVEVDTQATRHEQLTEGLVLHSVGGTAARGMGLEAANRILDDTGNRPLTVEFAPPPSTSPSAEGAFVAANQMYERVDGMTSAIDLTRIING